MNDAQIMQELTDAGAMMRGHFILSSGLHSDTYLQCARALMDAKRADRLGNALAEKLKQWMKNHQQAIDVIVSPAMGGVVIGYEMGRQLGMPAMFCERVEGQFELRRGFTLQPGQKALIVEDVVTTGKSSMEAARCITSYGGQAVAVASLIDRRGKNDTELALPLIALLTLDIPTYQPDQLPEHLQQVPARKPGSRFITQKAAS